MEVRFIAVLSEASGLSPSEVTLNSSTTAELLAEATDKALGKLTVSEIVAVSGKNRVTIYTKQDGWLVSDPIDGLQLLILARSQAQGTAHGG